MKKILVLLLVMLLSSLTSSFADEVQIGGLWYDIDTNKKEATVIKYKNGIQYRGNIAIPLTVNYQGVACKVTSIGSEAFENCSGLTSITIPNSVTSIGTEAFQYCSGLTSITIPNSVTSMKPFAFAVCTGLTSVTIPNSLKSISLGVFCKCSNLQSVTIPNSVEIIGLGAFENCPRLRSVTIPAKAQLVNNRVFDSSTIVSRAGTNPSSPTTTTSSTLYSGYYTQTGKRYCYNATSYDDIGTASLHNVTITNSEITVDNKTYARSGADGNWIHYGTQEGNHPIYLYNTATGDLKSRDIFKFYGLIVTDIFWVRGDQVALHRNAGTLSPVITTSPTIPTTTTTTTPTRQPHTCGYCNGTGYIMTDQGVTNFGYGTTTKYQKTCPSCGGKGVW